MINQILMIKIVLRYAKFHYSLQNGDGFISAKELGSMMRTMGRNPTEEELMDIMNEIDVDHNGIY